MMGGRGWLEAACSQVQHSLKTCLRVWFSCAVWRSFATPGLPYSVALAWIGYLIHTPRIIFLTKPSSASVGDLICYIHYNSRLRETLWSFSMTFERNYMLPTPRTKDIGLRESTLMISYDNAYSYSSVFCVIHKMMVHNMIAKFCNTFATPQ